MSEKEVIFLQIYSLRLYLVSLYIYHQTLTRSQIALSLSELTGNDIDVSPNISKPRAIASALPNGALTDFPAQATTATLLFVIVARDNEIFTFLFVTGTTTRLLCVSSVFGYILPTCPSVPTPIYVIYEMKQTNECCMLYAVLYQQQIENGKSIRVCQVLDAA